jgi:hypothetical protein
MGYTPMRKQWIHKILHYTITNGQGEVILRFHGKELSVHTQQRMGAFRLIKRYFKWESRVLDKNNA